MIVIVSKNTVKEGKVEEFRNLTKELIKLSQKEEGCIEYNLYQDTENPNILTFIEKWESEEDFKKHKETKHFTNIVPKIKSFNQEGELSLYKKAHK
ncbi:MAG: putative quinol monooxygenase [Eubacteriales bacterium]